MVGDHTHSEKLITVGPLYCTALLYYCCVAKCRALNMKKVLLPRAPTVPPPGPPSPPQLEIAHKKRYHGGSSSSNGNNNSSSRAGGGGGGGGASNGASAAAASSRAGSLSRPQSPRVIGAVTLAEAKAQLGPEFSILGGGRPCVARAVVAPDQALSVLRECTKETDKGIGDAFHLQG